MAIPEGLCQDSSGSNCERIVGREHDDSFSHMKSLGKKIKVFDEKDSRIFLHVMHFTGHQTVQGPKDSFSANCKLLKGL